MALRPDLAKSWQREDASRPPHGQAPLGPRGVAYLCMGPAAHLDVAIASFENLSAAAPELPTALITDRPERPPAVENFIHLEPSGDPGLDRVAALRSSPFDRTLLLQDDAYVCGNPGEILDLLDRFDLALPQARLLEPYPVDGIPGSFPELDCGVIALRRTAGISTMLEAWEATHQRLSHSPDPLPSSASLRLVLYENNHLRWSVLPPEYNCWFEHPGCLTATPIILRGNPDPDRCSSAASELAAQVHARAPIVHLGSALLAARGNSVELVSTLDRPGPARQRPHEPLQPLEDAESDCPIPARTSNPATTRSGESRERATRNSPGEDSHHDNARLLYVLGMHRSGTSAVTGSLPPFGFTMLGAGDLMSPDRANPRGYFESKTMQQVNDKLLASLGGTWASPPPLPEGWHRAPGIQQIHPSLRQIVSNLRPTDGPTAWKDPRLCLTLPVWRDALPYAGAAIFVYRHPHEVAASLATRDGIHPSQGLALWERYNRAALHCLAGVPVLIARYEDLLDDAHAWCDIVASFLDLNGIDRPSSLPYSLVEEFLDASLRRERVHGSGKSHVAGTSLLPATAELLSLLDTLRGSHSVWISPEVPEEEPWVTGMLKWGA
ncbi:MAG: sulfotransferase family protein [Acidimicrobiales bacterium]